MSSSARQSGVCDQCGRGLTILFSQDATNGALRWSWSAPCTDCGKNTGHDGTGRTPGEIRAAILGAEGEWTVAPRDPSSVAIPAIKALRAVYGLGLKEAKDQWEASALRGTRAECEALAWQLRQDSIESDILFAGAASAAAPTPQLHEIDTDQPGWSITLRGASGVAISGIKAIRATFRLGLKEAKDVWDAGVKTGVIKGTRQQCEALSKQFVLEKVPHEVKGPK